MQRDDLNEKEGKDYLIPEYEKRLQKAADLKKKIDNPEPDRLLNEHRALKKEFKEIFDEKTRYYLEIKKIIEAGHQLLKINARVKAAPSGGWGRVGWFKGDWSEAGHPEIHYGVSPWSVTTSRAADFKEITPKEFMNALMADPEQSE